MKNLPYGAEARTVNTVTQICLYRFDFGKQSSIQCV